MTDVFAGQAVVPAESTLPQAEAEPNRHRPTNRTKSQQLMLVALFMLMSRTDTSCRREVLDAVITAVCTSDQAYAKVAPPTGTRAAYFDVKKTELFHTAGLQARDATSSRPVDICP